MRTLQVVVSHRFPRLAIEVDFTAPATGITVLFGPSGAGKTSILAAAAGLLRTTRTEIWLDGEALHRLLPERRGIGFVFQDGRLFPHLNVIGNLRYGLRRTARVGPGLTEIVTLLGLESVLDRRPAMLSGGERQRVALGRALLARPRLLLMDEPLASLDTPRRFEVLPYLRRLADQTEVPVLYVTHARDELVRLADHVVLVHGGRIAASGRLPELAGRADLAWAHPAEAGGVLEGQVAEHLPARRLTRIACAGADVLVPLLDSPAGQSVRLVIPAREIILARTAPVETSVNNMLPVRVTAVFQEPAVAATLVELACGPDRLLARVTSDAASRLDLQPGQRLLALVKSVAVNIV